MTLLAKAAACALSIAFAIPGQLVAQTAATPTVPAQPRLVVFITVDQLAQPYIEKFGPEFTHGLRRMLDGGARFDHAFHDHALTETAPGHATLLSGRFPRSTGIVTNAAGVPDTTFALIGARNASSGASPYRFRGSVLMDWMRSKDVASRGLSVSRKDRSAILPFGRSQQPAFWYGGDGRFTTSRWFADTLPEWVRAFNSREMPQSYAGRAWTLLQPESQYPERDSVPIEAGGRNFMFPHVLSSTTTTAVSQIADYPFMDEVIMSFAVAGMRARSLGTDDHPDLLAVSFSTTDAIGHKYGSDSREIHDHLLRLDRIIGALMDSVYSQVDPSRVVFALSADHGTTPFPELRADSAGAAAMHVFLTRELADLRTALKPHGIDSASVSLTDGALAIDPAAIARAKYDPTPDLLKFLTAARAHRGVSDARLVKDLTRTDTVKNFYARRWLHMLPPDTRVVAVISPLPGHVWGRSASAEHGSPSDADAHVPIIFYGPQFKAGRYRETVRTVDIAPTLARVLGVVPTEKLDGVVLVRALR